MATPFQHLAISASAGAGKTFQLVHRYIGLLVCGAAAETIVALTFSRKAAGEMFDRIIQALAAAADTPEQAALLGRRLQQCQFAPRQLNLDCRQCTRLLRRVLAASHRLRVGTLDSFLVNIIQTFPFEFGLGGDLDILEGYPATAAKQEAMRHVFQGLKSSDSQAGRDFLESFRLATYGQEVKGFSATLQLFIDEYHALFLEAPAAGLWGEPGRIWPGGCHWLAALTYPRQEAEWLQQWLADQNLPEQQAQRCREFLAALPEFHPVADWKQVDYLYGKLREIQPDLAKGSGELNLNRRRVKLEGRAAAAAERVFAFVTARVLDSQLRRTRGLHHILQAYEKTYRLAIRQSGRLTFSDIASLLGRHPTDEEGEAPPLLSSMPGQDERLYLDYRMDSRFDHWLLDEFQDTSTLQWQAVDNLIDEVVQNAEGNRSFFYVGDVKQAIYGWRGGDPGLFDWLRRKYGSAIQTRPLSCSHRSSQPVIDLVNTVFHDLENREIALDPEVRQRWAQAWQHHQTARTDAPGFAAVYALQYQAGESGDERQRRRLEAALHLLKQIEPLKRGLSTAALVRTNQQGRELTNFLRNAGLPVHFVGKSGILDTPLNAGLVSLVRIAEHPGDSFAWQHLRMTPWRHKLPSATRPPASLIIDLLRKLVNHGLEALMREWAGEVAGELTVFERKRLEQLLEAARQFESMGGGRVAEFVSFLDSYEVEDAATMNTVQVMTIHQAKGLQFDLVLLPCLDRRSGIDSVGGGGGLHIARGDTADRRPQWVLNLPSKEVTKADPVLDRALNGMRADNAYEELCNLYVAMTRAKHGLYVLRSQPGPSSKAILPTTVIVSGLEPKSQREIEMNGEPVLELYQRGDPEWFQQPLLAPVQDQDSKSPPPVLTAPDDAAARRRRYQRETPSGDEEFSTDQAAWLFDRKNERYAQFGTALHAFIGRIEWFEPGLNLDQLYSSAMSELEIEERIARQALAQLRQALARPAIQQILARPETGGSHEVWRERRFELLMEQTWVSGCFDRVVLYRDRQGRPESAVIIDFKTSVIKSQADLDRARRVYNPQLQTYRQALARITGLPENTIRTQLVFTQSGDVI